MAQTDSSFSEQIAALAAQYGQPARVHYAAAEATCPITRRDAEILPVIRRTNGKLLVMTKGHYPNLVFRLPTGGIEPGEEIEAALWREVAEETGLQVTLERFLAVLTYERAAHQPPFTTIAFLLSEQGGTLECSDPDEGIAAFGEVLPHELFDVAARLRTLPDIAGYWTAWGRFRALSHDLIAGLTAEADIPVPQAHITTGN